MAKESLFKFAKGNEKPKKQQEKEKNLTPEEERDLKAKQMANTLLQDVKIPKIGEQANDDLLEVDNNHGNSTEINCLSASLSVEWLTEQLSLLTVENEKLRNEIMVAKEDYAKIFAEYQRFKGTAAPVDGEIKIKIIELFDELQNNYISMGINPHTGRENFIVRFPNFLQRMILFFPFLESKRKYKV
jgi:hypothetical protein